MDFFPERITRGMEQHNGIMAFNTGYYMKLHDNY